MSSSCSWPGWGTVTTSPSWPASWRTASRNRYRSTDTPDARVTASAGLATYTPGESAEDLMNRADHAMYRAKQAGVAGWEAFLEEE